MHGFETRIWRLLIAVLPAFMVIFVSVPAHSDKQVKGMTFIERPADDTDAEAFFKILDLNGDGQVTRAEFQAQRMYTFGLRDANSDGFLTPDEIPSFDQSLFDAIDKDGDGKISAFEFHQSTITNFDAIDINNDNVIVVEELQAIYDLYKKDK